jgi:hypothetical protein
MLRKVHFIIVGLVLVSAPLAATATDISFTSPLLQSQFRDLSREGGTALAYRKASPATPLGITGFDVGIEVSGADIKKESPYWQSAFGGDAPSYLTLPKLRIRKGLPFGIDVGGMYSWVPDSNVRLFGFELSKAILEGSTVMPALGIRGSYTKLTGVGDLGLDTFGVDATVSKGIAFLTPYAGAGVIRIDSEPRGRLQSLSAASTAPLSKEQIWQTRLFGGLEMKLLLLRLTAEVEYAVRPIYTLKASAGF